MRLPTAEPNASLNASGRSVKQKAARAAVTWWVGDKTCNNLLGWGQRVAYDVGTGWGWG